MVTLLAKGPYRLIETRNRVHILYLSEASYAWIKPAGKAEILVTTRRHHFTDSLLATGEYRLYEVRYRHTLSNCLHLELQTGAGQWQGYLLPNGLPNDEWKRRLIVPTRELISDNGTALLGRESYSSVLATGMQKSERL